MKKKKQTRISKKNTLQIVGLFIGGISAILADHFFPRTYLPMEDLFEIVFSMISVIAGIWITCYLLVLELFKDRYPFIFLQKEYMPKMKITFSLLGFSVLYGLLITLLGNYFWGVIFFAIISLVAIVIIAVTVYQSYKTLMVNTYIDKFFDEIKVDISSDRIESFQLASDHLWNVYNECVTREDYFIAKNISEKSGEIFRDFLTNSIRIARNTNLDNVESVFSKIVQFNIDQLDLCKNIQAEMMIDTIIDEQLANLRFCITHDRFEWYKKYISKFSTFVFRMQKEENKPLTESLFSVYHSILIKLIKENKIEWVVLTIDEIESFTMTYIFAYNKTNIRNYASLLTHLASSCVTQKKDDYYEHFEKKLKQFIGMRYSDKGIFGEVKVYYSFLFHELLEHDIEKAYRFLRIVMSHRAKYADDLILIDFKLYCIEKMEERMRVDPEKKNKLFHYHVDAIIEAIGLKKDSDSYYDLPDIFTKIQETGLVREKSEEIIDQVKRMLNYCVLKDNVPAYYAVLEEIKNALNKTEQQQKIVQETLLETYFWLFSRTLYLVNQQFFEITLDQFRDVLLDLDKYRKISTGLGQYIIEKLANCSHYGNREKTSHKLVTSIVDLLFSFMYEETEYHFVIAHAQHKKLVCRTLFNLGTECVENGFEEGVRKVSNALGWLIIYSIKQGSSDLASYLIGRASELFYIAKSIGVSPKTQMFMLTLFTTVGTYCCKDPHYTAYFNKILDGIADESIERVKIAVSLRTSENDMWNDLYDGKTSTLTKEFVSRFTKHKKAQDKKDKRLTSTILL